MNEKDEKDFLKLFPSITEQEEISDEVMNALEGSGSCGSSCTQACKRKNLKSGNDIGPNLSTFENCNRSQSVYLLYSKSIPYL